MASVNVELLTGKLKEILQTDEFAEKLERLKDCEFNPFQPPEAPGSPEGFDKWREAQELANDILSDVITVVERVVTDTGEVAQGKEKLDAVVNFVDDIIALPFYLEPFDKPLIRMLISQLVGLLNKCFGKNWIDKIPG